MMTHSDRMKARDGIDYIFMDLFSVRDMTAHPAQIKLSCQILDTTLDGGIALFDAETGIGKSTPILQWARRLTAAAPREGWVSSPSSFRPTALPCRTNISLFCQMC